MGPSALLTSLPLALLLPLSNLATALPAQSDDNNVPLFQSFANANKLSPKIFQTNGLPLSLNDLSLDGLTSKNTIPLRRLSPQALQSSTSGSSSSSWLRRRAAQINEATSPGGSALLRATGSTFLAPISLGGTSQTFNVVVDTGSSDTWVPRSDFTCVDVLTNRTKPQSQCYFGNTFPPSTQSFTQTPNVNFNITYGDGEYLTGIFGNTSVSIAGLTVQNQSVALATLAAWQGDGITSGILGLAYPALTARYTGTDPKRDVYCRPGSLPSRCNQSPYSPLLTNLFFEQKDNTVVPVFSLALSRDDNRSGNGGYLSIGGVPDSETVGVKLDARFASAEVKVLRGDDRYRYYLINVDGVVVLPSGSQIPDDDDNDGANGQNTGASNTKRNVLGDDVMIEGGESVVGSNQKRDDDSIEMEPGNGEEAEEGLVVAVRAALRRPRHWRQNSRRPTTTTSVARRTTTRQSMSTSTTRTSTRTSSRMGTSTSTSTSTATPSILAGSPNTPFILDSGTTLSFLPSPFVRSYLSSFSPPATYDPSTTFWFVNCSSTPPPLGIKIGGRTFWHNARDLIKVYDFSIDGRPRRCISGVQESGGFGSGINILGDVFLDSVLAVFDFRGVDGGGQFGSASGGMSGGLVRFAARREYKS